MDVYSGMMIARLEHEQRVQLLETVPDFDNLPTPYERRGRLWETKQWLATLGKRLIPIKEYTNRGREVQI